MKLEISVCVLALSWVMTFTNAALPGTWPPVDKAPPPVAEWTALVDQTKVAKAPIEKGETSDCPANDPFCNWSCTQCVRPESDIVQCPTKGDWGITFDDGPTQFTTPLLDFLDQSGDKVTFFVIGSRVFENPEILQRMVKAGHQIGVHTWSHPILTTQTNEQIIAEIKWTEAAIKQAVGLTPKYMRPPFGNYDDRVRNIATQLGYKVVVWDFDTNDWMSGESKDFQVSWIEGNFTEWVKTPSEIGHISLEHDLYQPSAEQGPKVIPIVKNAGFKIKPVSVCVGDAQPYVENVSLDASNATAPAAAPAASSPAAAAAAAPSTSYNNYAVAQDGPAMSSPAMASPSAMPNMPNGASLNNVNLSIVSLIVGLFMFFQL